MKTFAVSHPEKILHEIMVPKAIPLSREAALGVLSFKLKPSHRKRMNELLESTKDETITADELIELDSFRSAVRVLDLLHLKARKTLGMPLKLKN